MGSVNFAAPVFEFEKRNFRWRVHDVAGGMVSTLVEEIGISTKPFRYHERDVILQVQPDLEPGRFYWSVELKARKATKTLPPRPHVHRWGTAGTEAEGRLAAFESFLSYRHTRDAVEEPERVTFGW